MHGTSAMRPPEVFLDGKLLLGVCGRWRVLQWMTVDRDAYWTKFMPWLGNILKLLTDALNDLGVCQVPTCIHVISMEQCSMP